MGIEIFLNINKKNISKDDLYVVTSETYKKDLTYNDLINFSLNNIFKKDKIHQNVSELNELLKGQNVKAKILYLSKHSIHLKKLTLNDDENKKKDIKNACLLIQLEKPIHNNNIISFFIDIKKEIKENNAFVCILNRIEFIESYIFDNHKWVDVSNISINLGSSQIETSIESIEQLKDTEKWFFEDDDYDDNKDKLKLEQWFDFFKLLKNIYNDKEDLKSNTIIKFNKELFLLSKNKIDTNVGFDKKNFVLNINDNENYKLDNIKLEKTPNNFNEILDEIKISNNKKIEEYEEELEKLKEKVNKSDKKIKEEFDPINQQLNNKLDDIKSKINALNKEIESIENKISELNRLKEVKKYNKNKEIKLLEKQILNFKNEINKIKNLLKNEDTKNEKKQLEINYKDLEEKIKLLESKINESEQKILNLNSEHEKLEKQKNAEINSNQEEIKKCKKQLSDLNHEKQEIENEINIILKKIETEIININNSVKKNKEIKSKLVVIQTINKNIDSTISKVAEFIEFSYHIKEIKATNNNDNEFNFDDVPDCIINPNFDNEYCIDRRDNANLKKIKRMFFALKQLQEGYYKNFNLYNSIKTPSIINKKSNNLNSDIKEKYKLNQKQESAVTKAINTNDIFYLQGPPGTGKTQTLCAIAESIISDNKNLVMCSSTHEAINNFLERLHDFNKSDPNLLILKYRFTNNDITDKKCDELFSEEKLYENFIDAIFKNLIKEEDTNIKPLIDDFINKYSNEIPKIRNNNMLHLSYLEKIKDNIDFFNSNDNIKLLYNEYDEPLSPFSNFEEDKITMQDCEHCITTINNAYKNIENKDKSKYESILAFDDLIRKIINKKNIKELFNVKNVNDLYEFIPENKEDKIISKIKQIKQKCNDKKYKYQFLDYVFDRNLINVIGITTTSRQNIEINNKNKSLFSDYNIDYMLIDEISKSCTPEILSKAVLSKKIILSGDYRQLPPNPDFCDEYEINKIVEYIKKNKNDDNYWINKWIENININSNDIDKTKKIIRNDIEELYKTSFFVKQVDKIKKSENENSSYEFLNESWRFGGKILDIVNIQYDKEEKLKPVKNINHKYNLKLSNKNLDSELVMIDTSEVDNDLFNSYHESKIEFNKTFDQIYKPFNLNNKEIDKYSFNSTYNQYSALVVIKTIESLIENNENKLNENNRIGVITLTKSQKEIMKIYLNHFIDKDNKKLVKIDTIDNFQGREEEIIIVDFIRGELKVDSTKIQNLKKRDLSFLNEKERINVAISRAKSKLIIVGAFKNYLINQGNKFLKDYYDRCFGSDDSYVKFKGGN